MYITSKVLEEIHKNFRVTTNGFRFRVEQYTPTGFLWWKKSRWVPCYYVRETYGLRMRPREFISNDEAQAYLDTIVYAVASSNCTWQPVTPELLAQGKCSCNEQSTKE